MGSLLGFSEGGPSWASFRVCQGSKGVSSGGLYYLCVDGCVRGREGGGSVVSGI